ncbi:MAG: 4-hydroxy-tetrahydrodipicolinate reductase, partial [Verrucomicrobia bacterium]|nr:4-hydroxy-tetrahydrodipicolinate reductase [Verrucomicrobiota bacterium]
MLRMIITGAKGRMGQAVAACAKNFPGVAVAGRIDQGDDLAAALDGGDVVVDFSAHDATPAILELCAKKRKAVVIGTTGHSEMERNTVERWKSAIPIVWTANFSTGVNALFW